MAFLTHQTEIIDSMSVRTGLLGMVPSAGRRMRELCKASRNALATIARVWQQVYLNRQHGWKSNNPTRCGNGMTLTLLMNQLGVLGMSSHTRCRMSVLCKATIDALTSIKSEWRCAPLPTRAQIAERLLRPDPWAQAVQACFQGEEWDVTPTVFRS